jgi:hypothetical protein
VEIPGPRKRWGGTGWGIPVEALCDGLRALELPGDVDGGAAISHRDHLLPHGVLDGPERRVHVRVRLRGLDCAGPVRKSLRTRRTRGDGEDGKARDTCRVGFRQSVVSRFVFAGMLMVAWARGGTSRACEYDQSLSSYALSSIALRRPGVGLERIDMERT